MPARNPSDRALIARIASAERWAHTGDRQAATAPARKAFDDRFEKAVDPDGVLPPAERARRASSARSAYFTRLALKSAQARRKASEAAQELAQVEAELNGTEAA